MAPTGALGEAVLPVCVGVCACVQDIMLKRALKKLQRYLKGPKGFYGDFKREILRQETQSTGRDNFEEGTQRFFHVFLVGYLCLCLCLKFIKHFSRYLLL